MIKSLPSKSPHRVVRESTDQGSEKAPQFSNFDQVIQKEFGIINYLEVLYTESNSLASSSIKESGNTHP
jgi:hypothetical protein